MDTIFEHYKRTGYLHHAHIIEGAAAESVPTLLSSIEQYMGIVAQGNPDLMVTLYTSLGVDEARALRQAQLQSSFAGGKKIFIIGAQSFTREAQNALLKTLEEPTVDTHFFIIIPHLANILPTLKSRVIICELKGQSVNDDTKKFADTFLDSSLEQRFLMIKKLTDVKKGEHVDREEIRRTIDHVERILYVRIVHPRALNEIVRHDLVESNSGNTIFRELFKTKSYLADRGSSPKMLLENLAIVTSW